jgi:hypothetical protein
MNVSITRQRLGKNIPEDTLSKLGHPFLGKEPINKRI